MFTLNSFQSLTNIYMKSVVNKQTITKNNSLLIKKDQLGPVHKLYECEKYQNVVFTGSLV